MSRCSNQIRFKPLLLIPAIWLAACEIGLDTYGTVGEKHPEIADDEPSASDDPGSSDPSEDDGNYPADTEQPEFVLSCGDEVVANTAAAYGTESIDDYGCAGRDASGAEVVFEVDAGLRGMLTARLTEVEGDADLDIYVLSKNGPRASSAACIKYGDTEASWEASEDLSYYVVVDGHHGDVGSFTLDIGCEATLLEDDIEGRTYCLDWNTATITEPPQLTEMMAEMGFDLADYALLLSATSVDIQASAVSMTMGYAETGSCVQNLSAPTYDLTDDSDGDYYKGQFAVGPAEIGLPVMDLNIPIHDVEVQGQFIHDGSQIVDTEIRGEIDLTGFPSAVCEVFSCHPCPSEGETCMTFAADSAVLTDNGQGPLVPVH